MIFLAKKKSIIKENVTEDVVEDPECVVQVLHLLFSFLLTQSGACRQNKALDHLQDDVDELNSRVKGANQRARHLLGK